MKRPYVTSSIAEISSLMQGFSIEVLPAEVQRIRKFHDYLPEGTRVYIPHIGGDSDGIVCAARILHDSSMIPVPHIAARRLESRGSLAQFLRALTVEAGVTRVLLVAGDLSEPAGAFSSSLDVLQTGLLEGNGIKEFGIAGHPEGHPSVDSSTLLQAMADKYAYAENTGLAMHVTTQFLFDVMPLVRWRAEALATFLTAVPLDVGLAGLARMMTLMSFAKDCGVASSLSTVTHNVSRMWNFAANYSPDNIVLDLAALRTQTGQPLFRSLHLFPFGSFQRTAAWARALCAGDFKVDWRNSIIRTAGRGRSS